MTSLHRCFETSWMNQEWQQLVPIAEAELQEARPRGDHPTVVRALYDLGLAYRAINKPEPSAACEAEAAQIVTRLEAQLRSDPSSLLAAEFLIFKGDHLWPILGDHPEVRQVWERARAILERRADPLLGDVLSRLAEFDFVAGRWESCVPMYQVAIPLLEKQKPLSDRLPRDLNALGQALCHLQREGEAVQYFEKAVAYAPADDKQFLYSLWTAYADVLDRLGQPDKAADLRQRASNLLPKATPGADGFHV